MQMKKVYLNQKIKGNFLAYYSGFDYLIDNKDWIQHLGYIVTIFCNFCKVNLKQCSDENLLKLHSKSISFFKI